MYWIVPNEDGINATSHSKFQVNISILAIVGEELATLGKQKIGLR